MRQLINKAPELLCLGFRDALVKLMKYHRNPRILPCITVDIDYNRSTLAASNH
jgi:hypothetical protein